MKVFLDVGAHLGETLDVVRDPRWGFERIVSFEPAAACWSHIEAVADDRIELCRFGLWSTDATMVLNNPGAIGASMSPDKDEVTSTALCSFRDAATWFAENISIADEVFVKLNVEGAEADIVERLAETGELLKITHLLIHFDVRKIPSLRHREPKIRADLAAAHVEFHAADEIQFGVVSRGTRNWLRWCHADPRTRDLRYKRLARVIAGVRRDLYPLKAWFRGQRPTSRSPIRRSKSVT